MIAGRRDWQENVSQRKDYAREEITMEMERYQLIVPSGMDFGIFLVCSRCHRRHQQIDFSHPKKFGQGSRSCRVCSNRHGLIRKCGLNMCRQCFRQYAKDIGFQKLD
ncbi:small ribosomal subunit protein uS14-like [Lethenteron reissneri]|uniref:small ribosomal subunit protein uS14-like n=1 Tax=Lethenteron reissneri TaxID=7753 RepID=UPI002AB64C55|nr:small ribosomal subunit protein uS14-like [Lethenteron reissneri]